MIVRCPECKAEYKIDSSKISEKGGLIRCAKCQKAFQITRKNKFEITSVGKKEEKITGKVEPMIVTLNEPNSIMAEQYRSLQTQIIHATNSSSCNTFLVSSAVRGEGKTVTALNLAVVMAQDLEKDILLVDCDLRKPSIHSLLGLELECGLVDYLTNGVEFNELLIKTPVDRLAFISAGKEIPSNPTKLLISHRMDEFIKQTRSMYSYVIFDTPPIIPVTDASILGTKVDGVIFVIQDANAPRQLISKGLSLFEKANIMGLVLNNVQHIISGYPSYYKYYKY